MTEIKAESILNKEDGTLPYAYFNPRLEGNLTWVCGKDQEGRITSVFSMDKGTHKDKECEYLPNIEKARWVREELIKDGWQKLKPPEVTFTFPGEKEGRKLNRKQRRYLRRKVERFQRQNPFNNPPKSSGSSISDGYDLVVTPASLNPRGDKEK